MTGLAEEVVEEEWEEVGASGASHKPLRLNCGRGEVLRESAVSWRSRTHSGSWSPHEASRARRERDAAGPCTTRPTRAVDARLACLARPPQQPAVGRPVVSGFKLFVRPFALSASRPLLRQTHTQNAQARVSLSATTTAKRAKPQ